MVVITVPDQNRRMEHMRVSFCAEMEVKNYKVAQPGVDFDDFFANCFQ